MAEPEAQQRYLRYPIQLPLLSKPTGPTPVRAGMGWTHNLSKAGACVELAERLQPGMPLEVLLQAAHGSIEVEAQVVWTGEPVRAGGGIFHGMVFTRVVADQEQILGDLFRTSEAHVRHAGVRLTSEIAVTCQRKGEAGPPLHGSTGDLSRAGLLLRLPEAIPPGTALEVTLHIAGERLTAEGTVVWVDPPEARRSREPIRHGFRFATLGLFLAALP